MLLASLRTLAIIYTPIASVFGAKAILDLTTAPLEFKSMKILVVPGVHKYLDLFMYKIHTVHCKIHTVQCHTHTRSILYTCEANNISTLALHVK